MPCAAGTFSSAVGANSSAACQACAAGTFSAAPGSTSCTACPLGQYAFAGSASCAATIEADIADLFATGLSDSVCARVSGTNDLKCWGHNNKGQLGTGDTANRGDHPGEMGTALPVVNLGVGASAVSVCMGWTHTCAILSTDVVRCWGGNSQGQLGIGDRIDKLSPLASVAVPLGGKKPVSIACGGEYSCTVLSDGSVMCWGDNTHGGIGDASYTDALSPVSINIGTGITAKSVHAGYYHTCVVMQNDQIKCWGLNALSGWSGMLGLGDTTNRASPPATAVDLGPGRSVKVLSCGSVHCCAILDNDAVKCWGSYEGLGYGDTSGGRGDASGEMGANLPQLNLQTILKPTAIQAFNYGTCVLFTGGSLKCWGENYNYQAGYGTTGAIRNVPAAFINLGAGISAKRLAFTQNSACVLTNTSKVKCWGNNNNGQIGTGTSTMVTNVALAPTVDVGNFVCQACAPGTFVISNCLSCGACPAGSFSSASNSLQCSQCPAGSFSGSQGSRNCTLCPAGTYGAAANSSACQACPPGTFSSQLGATSSSTCATCPSGSTTLSSGSSNCTSVLQQKVKLTPNSGSSQHTCIIAADNSLKCWGANEYGQLGLGDSYYRGDSPNEMGNNLPSVNLGNGRYALQVCTAEYHTCALLDNSRVKCWGFNGNGWLGLGTAGNNVGASSNDMGDNLPFINLGSVSTVASILCGSLHVCAVFANRQMKCWGYGQEGQLGLNVSDNIGSSASQMGDNLPFVFLGNNLVLQETKASQGNTCAMFTNGRVKCWGRNSDYLLDSTAIHRGNAANSMGDNLAFMDTAKGVSVSSLDHISFGFSHACAITSAQGIRCWGSSGYSGYVGYADGALGYGDYTRRITPGPEINMGATVLQLELGYYFTCVLLAPSSAKCWGNNQQGQLGLGDTNPRTSPPAMAVNIGSGLAISRLYATKHSVCVVLTTSDMKCWGGNVIPATGSTAQLVGGAANTMGDSLPVVNLGSFACMICQPGTYMASKCFSCVSCAPGTFSNSIDAPTCSACPSGTFSAAGQGNCTLCPAGTFSVAGNTTACTPCLPGTASSAAGSSSCTACPAGTYTSGSNSSRCIPCPENFFSTAVGATSSSTCATCPSGSTTLSSGSSTCSPVLVPRVVAFANNSGGGHTCVLMEKGLVQCWGLNSHGHLGLGDTANRGDNPNEMGTFLPFFNTGSAGIVEQLCSGGAHTCALFLNNRVRCWGRNFAGQLGLGHTDDMGDSANEVGDSLPYVDLGTTERVAKISCGQAHTCVLFQDKSIKCWGANSEGQLGLGHANGMGDQAGEMGTSLPFVNVGNHANIADMKCTQSNTCVLYTDGTVKCWGNNNWYQLSSTQNAHVGDGPNEMGANLQPMNLGAGVVLASLDHIFLGRAHSCAVTSAQGIKCWGDNVPLGFTDSIQRTSPGTEILMSSAVNAVYGGTWHMCAILTDGGVRCWGHNNNGQLGNGGTPMQIAPPGSSVLLGTGRTARRLFVGGGHVCALLDNNDIKCWGVSGAGATGQGSPTDVLSPAAANPISLGTINCTICQPGTYMASKCFSCVSCAPGTFSNGTDAPTCSACPVGTSSASGQSSCTPCPAGQYADAPGTSTCMSCPAGTFSAAIGATSNATCQACPPGTFSSGGSAAACTPCQAGTFSQLAGANSSSACQACAAGMFSRAGNSTCTMCPAGTYASLLAGSSLCVACPVGTSSSALGAVNSTTCQACPIATYAASNGSSQCTSCGVGQTTLSPSSTSAGMCVCVAGRYRDVVQTYEDEGEFPPSAMSSCPMVQGKYTYAVGQSSSWANSYPARYSFLKDGWNTKWVSTGGMYSGGVAGASSALFMNQYRGEYMVVDMGGEFLLQAYRMIAINPVSWNVYGSSSADAWSNPSSCGAANPSSASWFLLDSKAEQYSYTENTVFVPSSVGAAAARTARYLAIQFPKILSNNVAAEVMEWIIRGMYAGPVLPACTPCPAGFYSDATNSSACMPCPAGYYSASGSAQCIICPVGSYSTSSSSPQCTQCPAGTSTMLAGSTSSAPCLPVVSRYLHRRIPPAPLSGSSGSATVTGQSFGNGVYTVATSSTHNTQNPLHAFDGTTTNFLTLGSTTNAADRYSYAIYNGSIDFAGDGYKGHWVSIVAPSGASMLPYAVYIKGSVSIDYNPGAYRMYGRRVGSAAWELLRSESAPVAYNGSAEHLGIVSDPAPRSQHYDSFAIEVSQMQGVPSALDVQYGIIYDMYFVGYEVGNCSAGTYAASSALCMHCPAGTASSAVGATSNATCATCGSGTYSNGTGAALCTPCAGGTASASTGASSSSVCQTCAPGTYAAPGSMACTPCAAGTYAASAGASACTPCTAGTYSTAVGATASSACTPCPSSTYSTVVGATAPSTCISCPPGTYASSFVVGGVSQSETCFPCATGTYSTSVGAIGNATCTKCPIGSYSPMPGASALSMCLSCPEGTYADTAGSSQCRACPAGTYSTATGAATQSTCQACPAGSYSPSGSSNCTLCPAGTYSTAPGTAQCTQCPQGYNTDQPGATTSTLCNNIVQRDPPGSACPSGTYAYSSTQCMGCPIGTYYGGTGATSPSACQACPTGTYANVTGQSACTPCAAGTSSSATRATSVGTCGICPAGTYSGAAASSCAACAPGTYSTSSLSSSCTSCAAGTYSTATGASSASTCQSCRAGTYSATVGASSDATCQSCAAGTYSAAVGANTSSACQRCVAGTYSAVVGANTSSTCQGCIAGTFSATVGASSASACTSCPAGSYSATVGASSNSTCVGCIAGTFSATVGASSSSTCQSCAAGTYSATVGAAASSTCQSCPAGSYSTVVGASTWLTCQSCAAGTYSGAVGAPSSDWCVQCTSGTYSTSVGATSNASCHPCDAGTYSTVYGAVSSSACVPCRTGTYSSAVGASSSSTCQECPPGTFSNVSGASTWSTCQACPDGSYASSVGSTACTQCVSGSATTPLDRQ
jgi:alpha-tubulin suppressor-like RCC1 family protein